MLRCSSYSQHQPKEAHHASAWHALLAPGETVVWMQVGTVDVQYARPAKYQGNWQTAITCMVLAKVRLTNSSDRRRRPHLKLLALTCSFGDNRFRQQAQPTWVAYRQQSERWTQVFFRLYAETEYSLVHRDHGAFMIVFWLAPSLLTRIKEQILCTKICPLNSRWCKLFCCCTLVFIVLLRLLHLWAHNINCWHRTCYVVRTFSL